jgi:hypothetical protein
MTLGAQEYIVSDTKEVGKYIDSEIGIEYEITDDDSMPGSGSVVVFEIEVFEHEALRDFISKNDLWLR